MITTVVFDLDDTLYDEIEYCESGFKAVAEFFSGLPRWPGAEQIFEALWAEFTSGNRTKTFNAVFEKLGIAYDEAIISSAVKIYRNHAPKITLPPDSREALEQLSSKYTLGLLTDGFLPAQQLKVEALGIKEYFKSIVYTEKLGREFWKPSPAGFEKIMTFLNVKPREAAYVADNEKKDFIAPNKLGLATIQIIRSNRIHTEPSHQADAAARHIIQKIGQLPTLLAKL